VRCDPVLQSIDLATLLGNVARQEYCHGCSLQLQTERKFPAIGLAVNQRHENKQKTTSEARIEKQRENPACPSPFVTVLPPSMPYSSRAFSSARRIPKLKLLGFTGLLAIIEARRSGVSPANGF
jgi:hypothetical protein